MRWDWVLLTGGLMGLSACSAGGERMAESKQDGSAQRGRIIGIGGVFFKAPDKDATRAWYSEHLGIADGGYGAIMKWREHDDPEKEQMTVWSVFPATSDYFGPGDSQFMMNYIVDDLDALLARLKEEGVRIDEKRMDESYGRFAWIYDLNGKKIELWEPVAGVL